MEAPKGYVNAHGEVASGSAAVCTTILRAIRDSRFESSCKVSIGGTKGYMIDKKADGEVASGSTPAV